MVRNMTEDEVRDKARELLGFTDSDEAQCGVGQLTTFNQLGFPGVSDKPDGWYLPNNPMDTALILETKATRIALGSKQVKELTCTSLSNAIKMWSAFFITARTYVCSEATRR